MQRNYLNNWKQYLSEQAVPGTAATTVAPTTDVAKAAYIKEIRDMLISMENSAAHKADTVAQIIVNNSNDFLTRQKDWADTAKYGAPLFKTPEVRYLNKD